MAYIDTPRYRVGDHAAWKEHEVVIAEPREFMFMPHPFEPKLMAGEYYIVCVYLKGMEDYGFYAKEDELKDLPNKDLMCSWDDCMWRPNNG